MAMDDGNNLPKKMVAEFLGTMGFIIAITGSVMLVAKMGFGLPGFLVCGLAGGLMLFAMIESFGKISGGHINPAVTVAMIVSKDISAKDGLCYIIAQIAGGVVGALLVVITFYSGTGDIFIPIADHDIPNLMYLAISEFICVFMLVSLVYCLVRSGSKKVSLAVGALVGGMIMCTASTFFANPAVDIARIFVGQVTIVQSLVYIVMAMIAAIVAAFVMAWLYPKENSA